MNQNTPLYGIGVVTDESFTYINCLAKSETRAIEIAINLRIEAREVKLSLVDDDLPIQDGPQSVIGIVTEDAFHFLSFVESSDPYPTEVINYYKKLIEVRVFEVKIDEEKTEIHCADHGNVGGIRIQMTDEVVWRSA
jgi:hypothetical protein